MSSAILNIPFLALGLLLRIIRNPTENTKSSLCIPMSHPKGLFHHPMLDSFGNEIHRYFHPDNISRAIPSLCADLVGPEREKKKECKHGVKETSILGVGLGRKVIR
jgi:hypothetical protein